MQLKDIMKKNVVTASEEELIPSIAKKMKEADIGCVVIVNSNSAKGIITDRDIAMRCISQGHDPNQCHARDHMSSSLVKASPATDIFDAAHMMTEHKVKRLPITEGDRLIGLVSFSDVAEALDRPVHDLLIGMGSIRRAA